MSVYLLNALISTQSPERACFSAFVMGRERLAFGCERLALGCERAKNHVQRVQHECNVHHGACKKLQKLQRKQRVSIDTLHVAVMSVLQLPSPLANRAEFCAQAGKAGR